MDRPHRARHWPVVVALLALTGAPRRALADSAGDAPRPTATAEGAENDEGLTQQRIEALQRERSSISRAAPIRLLVVGSVVGVASLELTALSAFMLSPAIEPKMGTAGLAFTGRL